VSLALLVPASSKADEWNMATKFTVNHSFEVPGAVLQANTPYIIRVLDSPSNRNVVQIYNEDQSKMLAMFMTISSERLQPVDDTTFTFIETESQYPLPVKEWFYPGRLRGHEFVYPKDQAMEIAQHAREPILATGSTNLHDLASLEVEAVGPLGTQVPVATTAANITQTDSTEAREETSVAAAENATAVNQPADQENVAEQENLENFGNEEAPAQIAQNAEPAPLPDTGLEEPAISEAAPAAAAQDENIDQNQDRELPATAGELPLIAMLGILCLGAGFGLKAFAARS